MIKMIAAVSANGVIGQDNKIPWNYPEDMKFFRKMTAGGTVIMGRKTWESIGRPLPKRRNIVVTRSLEPIPGVELALSVEAAITLAKAPLPEITEMESEGGPVVKTPQPDVWLIGGSSIYREGLKYADEIYLTLIPENVEGEGLIFFPWVNPVVYHYAELIHLEDSDLTVTKLVTTRA